MKTNLYFIIFSSFLFIMSSFPDKKKVLEEIKTHFMLNKFLFRKSYRLWDKVEIYFRVRQATDEDMVLVLWMLNTYGYRHILRMSNPCCFSRAKWLCESFSSLHLHVQCQSCLTTAVSIIIYSPPVKSHFISVTDCSHTRIEVNWKLNDNKLF